MIEVHFDNEITFFAAPRKMTVKNLLEVSSAKKIFTGARDSNKHDNKEVKKDAYLSDIGGKVLWLKTK